MAGKVNGHAKVEELKRYILLADTPVDVGGTAVTLAEAVNMAAELGGYRDSNSGMAIWAITRCCELLLTLKAGLERQEEVKAKAQEEVKAKVKA